MIHERRCGVVREAEQLTLMLRSIGHANHATQNGEDVLNLTFYLHAFMLPLGDVAEGLGMFEAKSSAHLRSVPLHAASPVIQPWHGESGLE